MRGPCWPNEQKSVSIESKKAESDLFAPIAGTLIEFNQVLRKTPHLSTSTNTTAVGCSTMRGDGAGLLSANDYLEHLEAVWEVTQRTIKGQLNS